MTTPTVTRDRADEQARAIEWLEIDYDDDSEIESPEMADDLEEASHSAMISVSDDHCEHERTGCTCWRIRSASWWSTSRPECTCWTLPSVPKPTGQHFIFCDYHPINREQVSP